MIYRNSTHSLPFLEKQATHSSLDAFNCSIFICSVGSISFMLYVRGLLVTDRVFEVESSEISSNAG